jgi:hypothetical protein
VAPSPPPEPDLAQRKIEAPKPPAPPPLPVTAEVEIAGAVKRPAGVKGEVTVWVTDAPCWDAAAKAYGETKANPDNFFVEVFVPQGSSLWVCAGVTNGAKPITVYGQAEKAPLLGKGIGEVTFSGLAVPLAKGKKVTAPPPKK